jgi:hypothetical protein
VDRRERDNPKRTSVDRFLLYLHEHRHVPPAPSTLPPLASEEETVIASFYTTFRNAYHGRYTFTTKLGRVSIGPLGTQPVQCRSCILRCTSAIHSTTR